MMIGTQSLTLSIIRRSISESFGKTTYSKYFGLEIRLRKTRHDHDSAEHDQDTDMSRNELSEAFKR